MEWFATLRPGTGRVSEICSEEGQWQLGTVHRGSWSVVRWQMALLSAQRTNVAEIAKLAFKRFAEGLIVNRGDQSWNPHF